jgi:hypothetical protein
VIHTALDFTLASKVYERCNKLFILSDCRSAIQSVCSSNTHN